KGNSILGFRVSGQLLDRKDDNPKAFGFYRANEDVIDRLEADPLSLTGGTLLSGAEGLTEDDVQLLKAAPNEQNTAIDLTGRLDARFSENVDLSVSGSYNNVEDRFSNGRAWGLLNWRNHPIQNFDVLRLNARVRHRLGSRSLQSAEETAGRVSLIRNAAYTLQFGYQKRTNSQSDFRHRDHFFDYGYVGSFDNTWIPAAGESMWSGAIPMLINGQFINVAHAGYVQMFNGWAPGSVNEAR